LDFIVFAVRRAWLLVWLLVCHAHSLAHSAYRSKLRTVRHSCVCCLKTLSCSIGNSKSQLHEARVRLL
jgi:hypothetical protein